MGQKMPTVLESLVKTWLELRQANAGKAQHVSMSKDGRNHDLHLDEMLEDPRGPIRRWMKLSLTDTNPEEIVAVHG